MKYGKHFAGVTAVVIVLSIIVYLLLRAIYQLPVAASAEAVGIDALFEGHFILIAFLFSLVLGFMFYSFVAFRRRPGDDSDGDHFHGHTGLEIMWTIVPLGVVIFFAVWGSQLLGEITAPKSNEVVVRVIGQQWSWSFEYPEQGDIRSTELVLEVDRPVRLEMVSLDVIHSFWVPEFRVKQDLLPVESRDLRFTPTIAGDYRVVCAEICGTQHASMVAPVRVLPPAEFAAWVDEASVSVVQLAPEERGEVWYEQFGCNSCHTIDGGSSVGPTWQGLYGSERSLDTGQSVVADEAYLERAILDPHAELVQGFPAVMPDNFEQRFAEEEEKYDGEVDILAELIMFIQALNEQGASGE